MTPADALDKAADIIETRGLWKGMNGGVLGGACVYTALGECDRDLLSPAIELLGKELRGTRWQGLIVRWNDAPETSKDEVVETLRSVAAEARVDA